MIKLNVFEINRKTIFEAKITNNCSGLTLLDNLQRTIRKQWRPLKDKQSITSRHRYADL